MLYDILPWAVQKWLNRSICRLGCGLGWTEGSTSSIVFDMWRQCAHMGGHNGATWRIRLNRPSEVTMQSYVKLLWPPAIIIRNLSSDADGIEQKTSIRVSCDHRNINHRYITRSLVVTETSTDGQHSTNSQRPTSRLLLACISVVSRVLERTATPHPLLNSNVAIHSLYSSPNSLIVNFE